MIANTPPKTQTVAPVAPKADNVLPARHLVKIYGGRAVVNGVDLNVNAGEIVGLLGPNGAGKTTSFYMVVGLVKPDKGDVFLSHGEGQEDENITKLPMYK